jgi:hypothetical protein
MKNVNDALKQHTGTDTLYKYVFNVYFTSGVHALCEQFQCYWFIDIVCSYQPWLKEASFQVWRLTVNEEASAQIICTDGNDLVLAKQSIPFTDFPCSEATVWVEDGVVLLPSEH